MEPVDVKADLQALRKLYGLLQSSGDGAQESKNETFVGKQLDERARLMLKNLLDVATEKTLETHSKIIAAAESRVSNSGSYFKSKQSNVIQKLGSPVLPYVFKSSPIAAGQRTSNSYNLTCRKDELSSSKPILQEVTLESSKASISSNRKKCCRVCQQQRSVEPQSCVTTQGNGIRVNGSVKEKGTESVKSNIASLKQKKTYEFERNPSVCSSSSLATVQNKNKPEVVRNSDFSREIANSIRRIDSGISSLLVKPSEMSNVSSPSQISKRVAKNSQLVTQFPARNVKAMDIETPAAAAMPTSQHVPPSNAYVAKQPPRPRSRPLNHMAHQKVVKSRPLMQPHQVVKSRPLMPPRQVIVRPTLIESDKSETTRMRRTRVGPHQLESEETWSSPSSSASASPSSSTSVSSSWTNEQSSTYSSDTDEPMSFPASSTRGLRSRGNAMYAHRAGDSSSSVSDQSNSSSSHYRSYHHQNPDKAIGRLRRIKNKLGLIFHHHHHHHHHHYDHQGNDDDSDHHSKVSRTKHSTWKNLRNVFHHKNINQKDDKLRKLTPHENQVKHFNKLVGGLRKQVKHSKKSKLKPPSKEGIGRLRNGGKKVQWWKIHKRHGGVKVGKKGRVKLGIQGRKSIKHLERR
ncbi:hypothetical protein Ddye_001449 [Dipteronia dyeriana]|uniref:Uncharacterized protein n=1 Tax=Dipteronia dyeriana TaxID=168575 RepID=A0AAE0CTD6_9ROSI|nr:hypothetical protein Ddye_001449 [Dipteronia dyeriana]